MNAWFQSSQIVERHQFPFAWVRISTFISGLHGEDDFSVSRYSISSIGVFSQTYLTNSWRITGDPTTPCSRLTCPPNAMCIVTVEGTAQCACSTPSCSKTSRTICGSNGKTYKNACDMEIESCQRNETIFTQHDGRCKGRQGTAYCDAPLLYCLLMSLITHALFNCKETHPRLNCCNCGHKKMKLPLWDGFGALICSCCMLVIHAVLPKQNWSARSPYCLFLDFRPKYV